MNSRKIPAATMGGSPSRSGGNEVGSGHDGQVDVRRAALIGVALLVGGGGVAGASTSSSSPIRIRVALDQRRVVAGRPIHGTAVLTNTTSRQVLVQSCARNGWLQVGLKGHGYTFRASSTLIACPPSIRLTPGANRFPVTVLTTYDGCLQPGGKSATSLPACTSKGPPPLPAGRYSTTVFVSGLAHMTEFSRPTTVTLLRPMEQKESPSSVLPCPKLFRPPGVRAHPNAAIAGGSDTGVSARGGIAHHLRLQAPDPHNRSRRAGIRSMPKRGSRRTRRTH